MSRLKKLTSYGLSLVMSVRTCVNSVYAPISLHICVGKVIKGYFITDPNVVELITMSSFTCYNILGTILLC